MDFSQLYLEAKAFNDGSIMASGKYEEGRRRSFSDDSVGKKFRGWCKGLDADTGPIVKGVF